MSDPERDNGTPWVWPEQVEADFGGPEEFGVEIGVTERHGFHIGQSVVAKKDYVDPQNKFEVAYAGDEGVVLGFVPAHPGGGPFSLPPRGPAVLVHWVEVDPDKIEPDYLESNV